MLVGSSARMTLGSTASTRAIATRCRCPPESSCGYFAAISCGGTRPTRAQQLVHALLDLRARDDLVDAQRPLDVVAHRLDRIQRVERILEDQLHLRAVVQDVAAPAHARDVVALEQHRAGARVVQAREQARDGALAAAALADERGDRPGRSSKETSSTACTCAGDAAADRKRFVRSRTSSGAVALMPCSLATRWHATSCPGSTGRSTGRSVVCRR